MKNIGGGKNTYYKYDIHLHDIDLISIAFARSTIISFINRLISPPTIYLHSLEARRILIHVQFYVICLDPIVPSSQIDTAYLARHIRRERFDLTCVSLLSSLSESYRGCFNGLQVGLVNGRE